MTEWNVAGNSNVSFGRKARLVTPSANDLAPPAKGVVMLAGGNLSIVPMDSDVIVSFTGVSAGFVPPYHVRRVVACSSACATID